LFLPSEGVYQIEGRGTAVVGRVERGRVRPEDEVEILGLRRGSRKVVVTGLEAFNQKLEEAQAGKDVGVLLCGVKRDEGERGQVLAKPGSIAPTPGSRRRSTCCRGTRADGTRRWSPAIGHSSPSAPPT
jgi:elongation factor Tu